MARSVRPLGLSLALLASVILYSILPLIQVGMILLIRMRLDAIQFETPAYFQGANVFDLPDGVLFVQTIFSILFLGIATLAWRGRPPMIRRVTPSASLLLTAFSLLTMALTVSAATPEEKALLWLRLALNLGAALYLAWYLNRGPARAFYG